MGGRGSSSGISSGNRILDKYNDALEYYISGEGMYLNNVLRERNGLTSADLYGDDRQIIKELDEATNRKYNGQDTLYRSVDASAIFGNISDSDYYDLQRYFEYKNDKQVSKSFMDKLRGKSERLIKSAEGKTITDKGFVSTSKDYKVAQQWGSFTGSDRPIVVEYKVGKNTKGIDVSRYDKKVSKADAQKEVLLGRNQKYKVKKVKMKNGAIHVTVDLQ